MVLEIIKEPAEVLRARAMEVDQEKITTPAMKKLMADMKETMFAANGIGLAAPQINLGQRVIVVLGPDGPIGVFNPVIKRKSLRVTLSEEGCLSVPKQYGTVKRYRKLTIAGFNEAGEKFTAQVTDMVAIIFQHEIDHLNGTLFIDKAKKIQHVK